MIALYAFCEFSGSVTLCAFMMFDAVYAPLDFDVLWTDVNPSNLRHDISNCLGIPYLSECTDSSVARDITGVIWGPHNRLFASMKVSIGSGPMRNVHMILDTGSPQTYLCSETFGAFHITIHHPNNPISVNMNGSRLSVLESPEQSHFNEVNVLGTDYLRITNARIEINFNNDSMHIHVPGV